MQYTLKIESFLSRKFLTYLRQENSLFYWLLSLIHLLSSIVYIKQFKLQLKMIGSKYCVEYYFYNEDNLPVQSFAFVIATSDEEAIQKAQNYSLSKITIISCTKYA